jgi:hypothetical protein
MISRWRLIAFPIAGLVLTGFPAACSRTQHCDVTMEAPARSPQGQAMSVTIVANGCLRTGLYRVTLNHGVASPPGSVATSVVAPLTGGGGTVLLEVPTGESWPNAFLTLTREPVTQCGANSECPFLAYRAVAIVSDQ